MAIRPAEASTIGRITENAPRMERGDWDAGLAAGLVAAAFTAFSQKHYQTRRAADKGRLPGVSELPP
jgi:hypothetical protein